MLTVTWEWDETMTRKIKRNAIRCNHCGDEIESVHVHDFRWCSCGSVFVDGGREYLRRGYRDSTADFEDLAEWEDVAGDHTQE